MTKAHDPKDGWKPLTSDITWAGEPKDASPEVLLRMAENERIKQGTEFGSDDLGAGQCPKVPEWQDMPGVRLPAFAGGKDPMRHDVDFVSGPGGTSGASSKDVYRLENELVKLAARVAELESHAVRTITQLSAVSLKLSGATTQMSPARSALRNLPLVEGDCE
jgi:hypothetical protein